jgi:proline iminopeptidase
MRLLVFILIFIVINSFSQIESFEGYKTINGTQLYFKVLAQPYKATGKGEPLLIVHGGPGLNHTYLLPHLKKLSKWYTLIFYDQRASGRSAIPSTDSVSLKFFVDDMEAIRKAFGINKLLILSHSWGAIQAVQYGLDYPDKVKGIIFCNPVALSQEYDDQTFEAQSSRVTGRDSTNRSIIIGSPDFKTGKADAYRRLMQLSFQHSFSDPANFSKLKLELQDTFKDASQVLYRGLGKDLANFNYYSSTQRFKFPALILHGKVDVIPLQASERMLESIPNSRLSIFRNSGHFIFIEEPNRFYQEVVSFSRMITAIKN